MQSRYEIIKIEYDCGNLKFQIRWDQYVCTPSDISRALRGLPSSEIRKFFDDLLYRSINDCCIYLVVHKELAQALKKIFNQYTSFRYMEQWLGSPYKEFNSNMDKWFGESRIKEEEKNVKRINRCN